MFIEYTFLDPTTLKSKGSYIKKYDRHSKLVRDYELAKDDPLCIVNVMFYNPKVKALQKNQYDLKLHSVEKNKEN